MCKKACLAYMNGVQLKSVGSRATLVWVLIPIQAYPNRVLLSELFTLVS